jgi:hypothetical protein
MYEITHLLLSMSIPLVAIVMGCGIPLMAIYVDYLKRRQIVDTCHRERLAAIEKGIPVPPFPEHLLENGLFDRQPRPSNPRRALLAGLIWLFVGIGVGGTAKALAKSARGFEDRRAPSIEMVGLIPAGIGVAYLIYYAIEGRKQIAHVAPTKTDGSC